MDSWKRHWGFEQWTAYFGTQSLPVNPASKRRLAELEENHGDRLAPRQLLEIVLGDPLLCLRLLREAERTRSHRLGRETTTALGAIMQLGVDAFRKLLRDSPEVDVDLPGLMVVEARSALAARIAMHWASAHSDVNPEEVAVSALLADTGELLLWVYAPELAQAALDELQSGRASRSSRAQVQACGFDFKSVTIRCAELWNLPALLQLLLRGAETLRAQLARLSSDTARHVLESTATVDQAIAHDLAAARRLIPTASPAWLLDPIDRLDPDRIAHILSLAAELPDVAA